MILKQNLKNYLHRKFFSLLKEDFSKKSDIFELEAKTKENLEHLAVKNDLDTFKSETAKMHDQYGQWIHQLFAYIGSLYMFSEDINEKKQEAAQALAENLAYLNRSEKRSKVVYTCLTGNYDNLPLHPHLDFEWDYVCFTDSAELLKLKSYGAWQIRPLAFDKLDNTKNARWHKTHPHLLFPDYEESIWIDANIAIKSDWIFSIVAEKRGANKILIPIHYERDSIFTDIEFCVNILKKETRENADRMIAYLREHDFPDDYGLNETNLIFRKHNDAEITSLMEDWWYFIENFTKRDQFSLSYVLFKHGIKPSDIAIPNLRPLVNSFRIDAIHAQKSVFSEPSQIPDYPVLPWKLEYCVETAEGYCAYVRRAGWIALDDDFDVYLKANRYFYKANKVTRQDVADKFSLSNNDVGFDVKISFFDVAEGELALYVVNKTKKEIYKKEIAK